MGGGRGVAGRRWWGKQKPVKATVEDLQSLLRIPLDSHSHSFLLFAIVAAAAFLLIVVAHIYTHKRWHAHLKRKSHYQTGEFYY